MEQIAAPVPAIFSLEQDGRKIDYIVHPPEWKGEIVTDPKHEHTPPIVCASRSFADTRSFSEYFTRFSDNRTLVTASRSSRRVFAQLDYHLDARTPSPIQHSVIRAFTSDRRFDAWKKFNGRDLMQIAFAEFLEDHLEDVHSPAQATLMKSIVQFKALQKTTCVSAVDLQNGDAKLEFVQETRNLRDGVVLPDRLMIRVPVLEFEREWEISARLRYNLNEGKVTFKYELIQIEDVEDLAFRTAVSDLEKVIKAPILLAD